MLGKIKKYRFLFLIICTLFYIVLSPLLKSFLTLRLLMNISISAMLISGVIALSQKKRNALIGTLLAIAELVSRWSLHFKKETYLIILSDVFGIFFFAFAAIVILTSVFRSYEIDVEVICGSIVVYLLWAVVFAFLYSLLEVVQPGSFSLAEGHSAQTDLLFLYYSFVTITTLGYGDMTPLSELASSLAIVEAVTGQLYIAVLIARLVGIHVAQSAAKKRQ